MKMFNKFICFSLCLFLLVGCNVKKEEEKKEEEPVVEVDGAYYVEQLRNLKVREKNSLDVKDDPEFAKLLQYAYEDSVTSSFLDFHYNVYNYRKQGLEKPEAKLGSYDYSLNTKEVEYWTSLLEDLRSFDYNSLSNSQQYDYDVLEFECICNLCKEYFYQYRFLLKAGDGVPDELISYFTDYTFHGLDEGNTKEDYEEIKEEIEDYLSCLADLPRVFDEVLVYTSKQAADGYPLLDAWIDEYQDTAKSFIEAGENNELIVSFADKIDALDELSNEEKEEYKNTQKDLILNKVTPAYEKLKNEIEQYRGKANIDDYAFISMDGDYAEYMIMAHCSSNDSIEDILLELTDALSLLEAEYVTSLYEEGSYQKTIDAIEGKYEVFTADFKDQVAYLAAHTSEYFPDIGEISYTVELLDPEVTPSNVAAYYWQAPYDNDELNIIRINPANKDPFTYGAYGTYAHEGFPGHCYQTIYYHRTNPSKFRYYTLNTLGYIEGWAEYASYYGYRMAGLNDDYAASVMFYDTNSFFLEYSIADILVNYYGYTTEEMMSFFEENTIFPNDYEHYEFLREIMIEYSSEYLPYGAGLAYMINLRDDVANKLGDNFDIMAFNKAMLDSGIMPLNVLKQEVYQRLNITQ